MAECSFSHLAQTQDDFEGFEEEAGVLTAQDGSNRSCKTRTCERCGEALLSAVAFEIHLRIHAEETVPVPACESKPPRNGPPLVKRTTETAGSGGSGAATRTRAAAAMNRASAAENRRAFAAPKTRAVAAKNRATAVKNRATEARNRAVEAKNRAAAAKKRATAAKLVATEAKNRAPAAKNRAPLANYKKRAASPDSSSGGRIRYPAVGMQAEELRPRKRPVVDVVEKAPSDRTSSCADCGRSFASLASLRVHGRTHTRGKPFLCTFCGDRFAYPDDMIKHVNAHGISLRRYSCRKCRVMYETPVELKLHDIQVHRPFQCSRCKCYFPTEEHRDRHVEFHK